MVLSVYRSPGSASVWKISQPAITSMEARGRNGAQVERLLETGVLNHTPGYQLADRPNADDTDRHA